MVHIVPTVGFAPLGAKLDDGSPHPHEGTGFGIILVRVYPTDNIKLNSHYDDDLYQYH